MKRYNRDKRAKYNARNKIMHTHDNCNAQSTRKTSRIHIPITYDGYNKTIYVPIIYGKTRNTHAQTYVSVTNTIRQTFPELDEAHTQPTHRANAPYRRIPPAYTPTRRPQYDTEEHIIKDTRTAKCIIMNDDDEIIYIGHIRRTRIVNVTRGTIDITLHRNKRKMQAYERAVDLNKIIHGMTIREIKAHDVELYYV